MSHSIVLFLLLASMPAPADIARDLETSVPRCQAGLTAGSPVPIERVSLPLIEDDKQLVSLVALIPDFDPARDVAVGILPNKHTYLVNAQIGRHDPGIYLGRGKFRRNKRLDKLTVSPGLVIRLRLSAEQVSRMAVEMSRRSRKRNLTCTRTTSRTLAHAGVAGMHPFILTPIQMLRGFDRFRNVDARVYLVNSDAEDLEDFEKQVKVGATKKKPTPAPADPRVRRASAGSCDDEDCFNCCVWTCMDWDGFTGMCQGSECGCSESGACESGACECGGSDSGGSDCGCD